MIEKMFLTVTLRTEVPDKTTAKYLVRIIKEKLSDHPKITVTSHATSHFDLPEVPI